MNKENYKITGYADSIANLPDYPSDEGYTAEMLKSLFDARTDKEVKEKFNEFVDAVAAELDLKLGNGAGEVGNENIADGAITKEKLAEAVLEVLERNNLNLANGDVADSIAQKFSGEYNPEYPDKQSTAEGVASASFGRYNKVVDKSIDDPESAENGYCSMAVNYNNTVSGNYSFSANHKNEVSGGSAAAFGYQNKVTGTAALGTGYMTEAKAPHSFTAGKGTKTTEQSQAAVGEYNAEDENALFVVGNGTSDTERSNAFSVNKDGTITVNGRTFTKSELEPQEEMLVRKGNESIAQKLSSGISTVGSKASAAFGMRNTIYQNSDYSMATGNNNVIGGLTNANGDIIGAVNSYVGGNGSKVYQGNAFAHGNKLEVTVAGAAAFGNYNLSDSTTMFSVGNGTSAEKRHNAFTVYRDNKIKIGDTVLTEANLKALLALAESESLASTEYVDNAIAEAITETLNTEV